MTDEHNQPTVTVTQIIHDLRSQKSYVTVVWKDQEEKKLGLPIPFGTAIDDIESETRKTLHAFRAELERVQIKAP